MFGQAMTSQENKYTAQMVRTSQQLAAFLNLSSPAGKKKPEANVTQMRIQFTTYAMVRAISVFWHII